MQNLTKKTIEDLLKNACDYQGKCLESRDQTRENYKKHEGDELNSLRMVIDGLIAKMAMDQNYKKIKDPNDKVSYQISLLVSFIRSHYLINDLFMQGDIIEAITLIRKQFESLTRLHEIDSKPLLKLHKKTPNVCNIFKKPGKMIYPKLSEVAHFGTPEVGELLQSIESGDLYGPSLIPVYHESSLGCLELNCFIVIHFLQWLIEKHKEFYDDFDGKNEELIFKHIVLQSHRLGVIRTPDEKEKV